MLKTRQKGFTLIELLVVIAIIGILSSVVLSSLNTARAKGRDARRISDVKQLQLALELYYDSTGSYPAAISTANLAGYISVIPDDPSVTGTCTLGTEASCYKYAALQGQSGTCTNYHLGATLEVGSNSVFDTDADADSSGTKCTGSNDNFVGTDPVYDVKP
ncbi:MAG: type II secretion system protein [bacterium]|nr:type II secretion system protein [bacterium]